jgi:hypothetical protein
MHWLIIPGPPISCYLAYTPPFEDPKEVSFYHKHPNTWSIHVVVSGTGRHYVEGQGHDIGPGTVIYQGPNVRHSIFPSPNSHLAHVSIQYPAAGYAQNEWVVCPEAGTADKFADLAAFAERFKSMDELVKKLRASEVFANDRWKTYVTNRKPDPAR